MPYVLKIHYSYTVFCGLIAISVLEQWEIHASMLLIANTIQKCNEISIIVYFSFTAQSLCYGIRTSVFLVLHIE